jgi:hypothetical protein
MNRTFGKSVGSASRGSASVREEAGMNGKLRTALLALVVILVVGGGASTATAQSTFRVTLKANITSIQVVAGTAFIEAEGHGVSPLLGPITADQSVTQVLVADECDPFTSEQVWSTAAGTLELQAEGEICDMFISGDWTVTGGSSGFTGSGTLDGVIGGQGNVVVTLEGTLAS